MYGAVDVVFAVDNYVCFCCWLLHHLQQRSNFRREEGGGALFASTYSAFTVDYQLKKLPICSICII